MSSIEIDLRCGWKIVGDPSIPGGADSLRIVDADGKLVKGVQRIKIDKGPTERVAISVELMPEMR